MAHHYITLPAVRELHVPVTGVVLVPGVVSQGPTVTGTVGRVNPGSVVRRHMKMAVLGVDPVGQELARLSVQRGNEVSVHGADPSTAMDAIDAIERRLDEDEDVRGTALEATTGLAPAVSGAGLVVETGTGGTDPADRLASVEELVDRETLLATSQPSVPVTAVTGGLTHPDRALGLRVNPDNTGVVELVATAATTPAVLDRMRTFLEGLGVTPAVVGESAGPLVVRLAVAAELEAMRLLDAGVAGVETIDDLVTTGQDHPVGPLERADRVGLDHRLEFLEYLAEEVGEQYEPPAVLTERVAVGRTGADVGEGFYVWEQGEPTRPAVDGPAFDSGGN